MCLPTSVQVCGLQRTGSFCALPLLPAAGAAPLAVAPVEHCSWHVLTRLVVRVRRHCAPAVLACPAQSFLTPATLVADIEGPTALVPAAVVKTAFQAEKRYTKTIFTRRSLQSLQYKSLLQYDCEDQHER